MQWSGQFWSLEGAAKGAIEESIAGALKKAEVPRSAVLAICLALAGVDRKEDIDSYLPWIRYIAPLLSYLPLSFHLAINVISIVTVYVLFTFCSFLVSLWGQIKSSLGLWSFRDNLYLNSVTALCVGYIPTHCFDIVSCFSRV